MINHEFEGLKGYSSGSNTFYNVWYWGSNPLPNLGSGINTPYWICYLGNLVNRLRNPNSSQLQIPSFGSPSKFAAFRTLKIIV